MLADGEVPLKDQPDFFNRLGKMCRDLKTVPDSMRIGDCSNEFVDGEYEGGFATVFKSKHQDREVAVKTLRFYLTSDYEEHFGVSAVFQPLWRGIHSN